MSTTICWIGIVGRDALLAMNGEAMPARPRAPTPFKKSRRTILFGAGRNVREVEIGAILVFDLKEVTEDDVSLGFMLMIFRRFPVGARINLGIPLACYQAVS